MREGAVLMIVLYPLESSLLGKFDWWRFFFVAALALVLLRQGIILEGGGE